MNSEINIIPERILKSIFQVRGQKVILDSDLAKLYGVQTKRLNEQVKRNIERFPEDFMFQLTSEEWQVLRSQFATSREKSLNDWGGRRIAPYVFTELGVAMLSSVLNSQIAINVNISIMRVFVNLRKWSADYSDLLSRIEELTQTNQIHEGHIRNIYEMIENLINPKNIERTPIEFNQHN